MYSGELLNLDNISLKERNSFIKSILSTTLSFTKCVAKDNVRKRSNRTWHWRHIQVELLSQSPPRLLWGTVEWLWLAGSLWYWSHLQVKTYLFKRIYDCNYPDPHTWHLMTFRLFMMCLFFLSVNSLIILIQIHIINCFITVYLYINC